MVYWKFCWIRKEHIGRTWMIWGYLPWLWNPPYGNMRSEDVGILVDRRYWSWYSTIITWCDMIWCDVTWHDWSYIMWFESKGYIVGVELYLQSWGYPMIHAKKNTFTKYMQHMRAAWPCRIGELFIMASMGIGHPWPSQVPRSSASLRDSARVRLLQSSSMLYRCQLSKRKLLKPKSSKLTMTRKFPTKSSHRCREKTGRGGFFNSACEGSCSHFGFAWYR